MEGGDDVGEGCDGLRSSLGGTGGGVLKGVAGPGLEPLLLLCDCTVVGVEVELLVTEDDQILLL